MRILSMRSGAAPEIPFGRLPIGDEQAATAIRGLGGALARCRADHQALFMAAEELIPSLRGRLSEESPLLSGDEPAASSQAVAAALHCHWQQAHPEAGPAYWLTRSWGMLCWQSIYLSMVAVYRLGAVPALHRMGQGHRAGLVSGFTLPPEPMQKREDTAQLIAVAGARLQRHWQALFEAFAAGQRLRPGFVRPLLADDLLAALARVPDFFGEISRERVTADAPRWLAACGLPAEHLAGWREGSASVDVVVSPGYVRQRCCLHYKRSDGELCCNCPRRQDARVR